MPSTIAFLFLLFYLLMCQILPLRADGAEKVQKHNSFHSQEIVRNVPSEKV